MVLLAETGPLIGFFLPGDSPLFTAAVPAAAPAGATLHLPLAGCRSPRCSARARGPRAGGRPSGRRDQRRDHRGQWRWAARRGTLTGTGSVALAVAAGWLAGGVVQDAVAHKDFAGSTRRSPPSWPDTSPKAWPGSRFSTARLKNPPGLWLNGSTAILFARLLQRGHST